MLNVSLLGGASFSIGGALVKSDLGHSGRLLACYLFEFPGRVHRRERLADLFWQEAEAEKARSALNTAIWRIRKILDLSSLGSSKLLRTLGSDVILEHNDSIHVDTHQLEAASKFILNRRPGNVLADEEMQNVGIVLDTYAGPFLDGYSDDWVLQERERLHCLFVRSAFELMRSAAAEGRYERALEFGRRIVSTDALRENVQRDVLLLLVLNGQRAEAIRSYQRFCEALKSELDIAPMPETRQLYGEILSGRIFDGIENHVQVQFGSQRVVRDRETFART